MLRTLGGVKKHLEKMKNTRFQANWGLDGFGTRNQPNDEMHSLLVCTHFLILWAEKNNKKEED